MLFVTTVHAVCPVCIVGVGGGLIIAEWLGVDDLLVAIWIMGLTFAMSFWLAGWLEKKFGEKKIMGKKMMTNGYFWSLLMFLMVIAYFVWDGKLGYKYLWGVDRLIIGSVLGALAFIGSLQLEKKLRQKNNGKAYFPFQKVVIPLVSLLLATVIGILLLVIGGVI